MGELLRVLILHGGYNTTVVMLGAAALGIAAGAVGVFAMLRRRALVSDAVAHATLPGIAAAFIAAAAVCLVALALVFKELAAVAFDPAFATASGLSVTRLDAVVAALSLAVVVIGLRVVGLVLIVALLVIPPAAARFWSNHAGIMTVVSAAMAAASA